MWLLLIDRSSNLSPGGRALGNLGGHFLTLALWHAVWNRVQKDIGSDRDMALLTGIQIHQGTP